jgi:hypothetical protein
MVNNKYESNNNNNNIVAEYNTFCDARGCNKVATNRLKIFYLKPHTAGYVMTINNIFTRRASRIYFL